MNNAAKIVFCITAAGTVLCATARPARDNEVVYFTDRTMKIQAGDFMMYCSGLQDNWGVRTPYWARYQVGCDGLTPPPIGPNCDVDGVYQNCPQDIWNFLDQR